MKIEIVIPMNKTKVRVLNKLMEINGKYFNPKMLKANPFKWENSRQFANAISRYLKFGENPTGWKNPLLMNSRQTKKTI